MSPARWLAPAAVTLVAAAFAWLNRGERVAVDLGIATLYRAPLTAVFFVSFLAGMLSMLALGMRSDLRLRRELRARGLLDAPIAALPRPASQPEPEPSAEPEPAYRPDDRHPGA